MVIKDQWVDPYPVEVSTLNGKQVKEDPVFATQIIDGKGYRIGMPPGGGSGLMKSYCIGEVEIIDGKAVIIEKPKKQVTDTPPGQISQAWNIDVQTFVTKSPNDSTCKGNITSEKQTFVTTGRPKAVLPVDEIIKLYKEGQSSRNIVMLLNLKVSYRTVARVIEGQGVLV